LDRYEKEVMKWRAKRFKELERKKKRRIKEFEEVADNDKKFLEKLGGRKYAKIVDRQRIPLTKERICHRCGKTDAMIVWGVTECCKSCVKRIAEVDGKVTILSKRAALLIDPLHGIIERKKCPICGKRCILLYTVNIRMCQKCWKRVSNG